MKTQFAVSSDGTRIAYDLTGRGPFLMLLHGAGKDRRDWHKLGYVDRLSEEFTVITVDIRGSGESDLLLDIPDYAIEKICADLYAVADTCQAEQFAIWGYSFGGNISRYLGVASDRVQAMAVIGVPLDQAVDDELDLFINQFVEKWGAQAEAHKEIQTSSTVKSKIKGRIPAWVACFQAMRLWPDIDPRMIRCPTLMVVGSRNLSAYNWIQKHQKLLESAKVNVELMDGLNHAQEFSQVERVFPVVYQFFRQHASDPALRP